MAKVYWTARDAVFLPRYLGKNRSVTSHGMKNARWNFLSVSHHHHARDLCMFPSDGRTYWNSEIYTSNFKFF